MLFAKVDNTRVEPGDEFQYHGTNRQHGGEYNYEAQKQFGISYFVACCDVHDD